MNALRRLIAGMPETAEPATPALPTNIVPDLRTIPEFAAAERLEIELRERLDVLIAERKEVVARVVGADGGPQPGNAVDVRVAQLMGRPAASPAVSDKERLATLNDDVAAMKDAVEVAVRERREAWLKASQQIADSVQDHHRELLLELAGHLLNARAAWQAYDDFLRQFEVQGVAYARLRPQRPDFLGRGPKVLDNPLRLWLRDLMQAGFLTRGDIGE